MMQPGIYARSDLAAFLLLNYLFVTKWGAMSPASDQKQLLKSNTPSAQTLIELRGKILSEWETTVREKISAATNLPHPILLDTVPTFVDNLVESLAEEHSREFASEENSVPQEHGSERARLSNYNPDQLILEYQILRDLIIAHLQKSGSLTEKDRHVINHSFDAAVCEAMTAYFLVHNTIRETFINALTHDLRNPLGSAKMAAELLAMGLDQLPPSEDLDDLRSLAERIIRNTKRCDRMIQNLLDTSVVQSGERMLLKITEGEVLSIIRDIVSDMNRKDSMRVRIQGGVTWGHWDCETLRRAIENLIMNGVKYGHPDKPISVRVTTENERIKISVHNEGEPIPASEQENLFQVYRRSEAARAGEKQGWGIGLALVRSVAEAHSGSIGVDSSAQRGTTFNIDIPVDARITV
jgi:signal transduction histidine kinase